MATTYLDQHNGVTLARLLLHITFISAQLHTKLSSKTRLKGVKIALKTRSILARLEFLENNEKTRYLTASDKSISRDASEGYVYSYKRER